MSRTLTRQKIISDCAPLFNQKGYLHVGIPEIEKTTGQTKPVLYGYFDNKYALAKAVLQYNIARRQDLIQQQVNLQNSFTDKLAVYIEIYYPESSLFPGGCPILNAGIEATNADEELQQITAEALLNWKQDITVLLNAGIHAKEFEPVLSTDKMAWLFISLIDGAIFIGNTSRNNKLCRQLLDQAKTTILNQLLVAR